jgi:hypothetical protein
VKCRITSGSDTSGRVAEKPLTSDFGILALDRFPVVLFSCSVGNGGRCPTFPGFDLSIMRGSSHAA